MYLRIHTLRQSYRLLSFRKQSTIFVSVPFNPRLCTLGHHSFFMGFKWFINDYIKKRKYSYFLSNMCATLQQGATGHYLGLLAFPESPPGAENALISRSRWWLQGKHITFLWGPGCRCRTSPAKIHRLWLVFWVPRKAETLVALWTAFPSYFSPWLQFSVTLNCELAQRFEMTKQNELQNSLGLLFVHPSFLSQQADAVKQVTKITGFGGMGYRHFQGGRIVSVANYSLHHSHSAAVCWSVFKTLKIKSNYSFCNLLSPWIVRQLLKLENSYYSGQAAILAFCLLWSYHFNVCDD